ncbi:MAG: aminotransferase class I/II-fold pyridoxal phosphate-dependent enzyme, partial [Opitutales bacterium]|nr:aminotransferase class I/II-fold pyridoxal phosphate-dependent enzyme [Opitutales bacterium]
GENGAGTASIFGKRDEVDIHYGTFSKALGSVGGFCASTRAVVDYLRYYARSTFFSSAMPATTVAGILKAMELVKSEPQILLNLRRNHDFFQSELEKRGFNTLNSRSAIIPVLVGDEEKLASLQMAMFERGIFSNIGTTPAVNASKCRLRLNVMATHTIEDLGFAADVLEELGKRFKILQ